MSAAWTARVTASTASSPLSQTTTSTRRDPSVTVVDCMATPRFGLQGRARSALQMAYPGRVERTPPLSTWWVVSQGELSAEHDAAVAGQGELFDPVGGD